VVAAFAFAFSRSELTLRVAVAQGVVVLSLSYPLLRLGAFRHLARQGTAIGLAESDCERRITCPICARVFARILRVRVKSNCTHKELQDDRQEMVWLGLS
jgi:hypothetical protein